MLKTRRLSARSLLVVATMAVGLVLWRWRYGVLVGVGSAIALACGWLS
ncbi:hypothetical protein KR51_00021380 [Rubidibacter lacunae KORDI 51-2]|uniref:Uncharacterized protein n=1 Tax=Rubidibacter lacunae KORDI 51-2 TaxID=582515 RepID=U5DNG6_9CHRO|nr:hypothetical protein [Rubidibacter lacunae]ERN41250.1 hypothetical protein KR51_00021380 [Rubidibacter lacunae KORDI 51-2]